MCEKLQLTTFAFLCRCVARSVALGFWTDIEGYEVRKRVRTRTRVTGALDGRIGGVFGWRVVALKLMLVRVGSLRGTEIELTSRGSKFHGIGGELGESGNGEVTRCSGRRPVLVWIFLVGI